MRLISLSERALLTFPSRRRATGPMLAAWLRARRLTDWYAIMISDNDRRLLATTWAWRALRHLADDNITQAVIALRAAISSLVDDEGKGIFE